MTTSHDVPCPAPSAVRSLADLPRLGVGLVHASALDPLLERDPGCCDVIEVEPQTSWTETRPGRYRADAETLRALAALPCAKIVHGVANPVGGSRGLELRQLALVAHAARALDAPWTSEHLAFQRAAAGGVPFSTGFLLPPRQTPAGVAAAAGAARATQAALGRPLLIETGVSYLKPRAEEISDGAFVRAVCEEADCGILLDVFNVYCNERNGRQTVEDFLAELPLERVVEVHLAGGLERGGFLLDAHSGRIAPEVLALARRVLPRLPNLKALVFEVFPSWIGALGLDGVRRELDVLRALWRVAGAGEPTPPPPPRERPTSRLDADGLDDVREWEDALGALVARRPAAGALAAELAQDPGVAVARDLVDEFRASMVASALPLTLRLLLLTVGPDRVRALLEDHATRTAPARFAGTEGESFGAFLAAARLTDVPWLDDVLAYERGLLRAAATNRAVVVPFAHDPLKILRPLGRGRLPADPDPGRYEVAITV